MSACYSEEMLFAFLDDEAGGARQDIEAHLATCSVCAGRVASYRSASRALSDTVDAALGDVDSLVALSKIHARIKAAEEQSPWAKLTRAWNDAWAFHRRALIGVAVAAGLGALVAPMVVLWAGRAVQERGHGAAFASVVIESVQVDGNAKTVLYEGDDGTTTLIWVEPKR